MEIILSEYEKIVTGGEFIQARHAFALICREGECRARMFQVAIMMSSTFDTCGGLMDQRMHAAHTDDIRDA